MSATDSTAGSDEYFLAALRRAQELVEADSSLSLRATQDLKQGINNRVLRGHWRGQPVVIKYYGDPRSGHEAAARRRGIELYALERFAASGVVPRLIATAFPDVLIMEEMPGIPLQELYERCHTEEGWPEYLKRVSFDLGRTHGKMLLTALSESPHRAFAQEFCAGRSLEAQMSAALATAAEIVATVSEFGEPENASLRTIRFEMDRVLAQSPIVYKYDQNPGNVIVNDFGSFRAAGFDSSRAEDDTISGLVDFEQCNLGTELIYLGAIFDCLNFLDWEALQSGFEAQTASRVSAQYFPTVVAMAQYNNWLRTTMLWRGANNSISDARAQRLHQRFARYHAILNA